MVHSQRFYSKKYHFNLAFGSCWIICTAAFSSCLCVVPMWRLACIPEDVSIEGEEHGRKGELPFADHPL